MDLHIIFARSIPKKSQVPEIFVLLPWQNTPQFTLCQVAPNASACWSISQPPPEGLQNQPNKKNSISKSNLQVGSMDHTTCGINLMVNLEKSTGETGSYESCSSVPGPDGVYIYISTLISSKINKNHVSHEKNPSYFPLYWLVNTDPYNGLL